MVTGVTPELCMKQQKKLLKQLIIAFRMQYHSNKIRLLCSIVNAKIEYLDEKVPLLMCDLIYKLYPDQDIVEIAA